MSDLPTFDFWFEFASTYSYLTAGRIEKLSQQKGVLPVWKPFLLGPIFREQGLADSPFNLFPMKGRYMWKDLERRCGKYELPFLRPAIFPQNGLMAARIATAYCEEDWIHEFVKLVYKAEFALGKDISQPSVLKEILNDLGQPGNEIFSSSESPVSKSLLRENTETAKSLGIFGAPSFIVKGELFWGDDRLEDAIEFLIRS
ncbi:DSBA-like thioredoxin domain protein [Leptospira broomii serovar Hurstbridge str. 5399]|uniref:2-hydroxychromene-2-carboxylate isomerase n=1 Tax=Leptospira broomii serovar Hurstbridge str. 5399 TaxID=1049789 RepID=T0FEV4_9LEPT|nr:2-hydroxychromene-2-carboxylate isomerase [Leptospira broomii]EQA46112.1 DSBA-like thioredoxin domain protein [Leptospira broomii serovar Hurstbridge str. 5399]